MTADRWIPVSERLPEHGRDVLACELGHIIGIMSFAGDCWYTDGECFRVELSDVTHWRPLPQPPAEGE